MKQTLDKRFWSKVDVRGPDDCWEWQAGIKSTGRGMFSIGRKNIQAHRMAWELTNGEIPGDLQVLHTCDNGKCCNPNHLYIGTHLDNMRDKVVRHRCNSLKGESDPKHKLTEAQVRFIRAHYKPFDREYGQGGLARMFNIPRTAVQAVIDRRNWKHIT